MVDVAQFERLPTSDVLSLAVTLHRGVVEGEALKLALAADWADRHCPATFDPELVARDASGKVIPGADRARLFGGDGTPEVMEFAPAELGIAYEISRWQANRLIADALDLRHRLPRLWARVLAGEVPAWKACKIAAATRDLSKEAAGKVDADVYDTVTRESWSRFGDILAGRIIAADPDLAQVLAEKAARARYVRTGATNHHGMKSIHAQGPQAAVLRLMAQINRLAKMMGALGDHDTPDERRSKAIMLLGDPDEVLGLITASEGIDLSDVDIDDENSGLMGGEGDGHYVPNNAKPYTHEDDYTEPPDPNLDPDLDGPPDDLHETSGDDGEHGDSLNNRRTVPEDERDRSDAGDDDDETVRDRTGGDSGSSHRSDPGEEADASTAGVGQRENSAHTASPADNATDSTDPDSSQSTNSTADGGSDHTTGQNRETGRPPPDPGQRENSAHSRWGSRPGARTLSPSVAKAILKAIAESGLDPAKIGPPVVLYHHYAHESMIDGNGTVRLEGVGAMTLREIVDYLHPFGRITVKPVIDLNATQMPVDAYETPMRLREQLHLRSPGDSYPWSNYTGRRVQMDHTIPYLPPAKGGPPGQTWLGGLAPLATFSHRVKTHGGLRVRQPRPGTLVWRTRNGLVAITDHTGTHNLGTDAFAQSVWRAACTVNGEVEGRSRVNDHPDQAEASPMEKWARAFTVHIPGPDSSPEEQRRPVWKVLKQVRLTW